MESVRVARPIGGFSIWQFGDCYQVFFGRRHVDLAPVWVTRDLTSARRWIISHQIVPVREPPTPVRLNAAERLELQQGAAALGETISATLRAGGLARARKALAKRRLTAVLAPA